MIEEKCEQKCNNKLESTRLRLGWTDRIFKLEFTLYMMKNEISERCDSYILV